MEADECDFYELKKNSNFCKHFSGNVFNNRDIIHCVNYCSLKESESCMKERSYERHKGVIRQVRHV